VRRNDSTYMFKHDPAGQRGALLVNKVKRIFEYFYAHIVLNSPYYYDDNFISIIRENNYSFWQTMLTFETYTEKFI
jgi:hypothetical protein